MEAPSGQWFLSARSSWLNTGNESQEGSQIGARLRRPERQSQLWRLLWRLVHSLLFARAPPGSLFMQRRALPSSLLSHQRLMTQPALLFFFFPFPLNFLSNHV